jgi:RTC4-like domain
MAHSMDHFGPHIGSIACFDSLIATCGVTTYAREVLIPEMAVMLVKEDMGVDDAKARRITGRALLSLELLLSAAQCFLQGMWIQERI